MDETDVPYTASHEADTAVSEDEALVETPNGERYRSLEINKSGFPGGEPYPLTERFRDYYDVLLSRYDNIF